MNQEKAPENVLPHGSDKIPLHRFCNSIILRMNMFEKDCRNTLEGDSVLTMSEWFALYLKWLQERKCTTK